MRSGVRSPSAPPSVITMHPFMWSLFSLGKAPADPAGTPPVGVAAASSTCSGHDVDQVVPIAHERVVGRELCVLLRSAGYPGSAACVDVYGVGAGAASRASPDAT